MLIKINVKFTINHVKVKKKKMEEYNTDRHEEVLRTDCLIG